MGTNIDRCITTSSSPCLVAALVSIMSTQKCYDVAFKLRAVKCAENNSKEAAERAIYVCVFRGRVEKGPEGNGAWSSIRGNTVHFNIVSFC